MPILPQIELSRVGLAISDLDLAFFDLNVEFTLLSRLDPELAAFINCFSAKEDNPELPKTCAILVRKLLNEQAESQGQTLPLIAPETVQAVCEQTIESEDYLFRLGKVLLDENPYLFHGIYILAKKSINPDQVMNLALITYALLHHQVLTDQKSQPTASGKYLH